MNSFLYLFMFALVNLLLSDFMYRCIQYLYSVHSDLLIKHQVSKNSVKWNSFILLYILGLGWGFVLLIQNINPLSFIWQWIILLLLNMVIITDYEQRLIFDRILLAVVGVTIVSGGGLEISFLSRLCGAVIGGLVMLLLAFIMRGTLGGGDIKLVIALGFWQGLAHLKVILFGGFLLGGVVAFFLLFLRLKKRTDYFAYGPYFVFSAWINLF